MPCASITVTKRAPICKHARLRWLGLYGERRMGYKTIFMDQDKAARARDFARRVMTQLPAEE